MAPDSADTSARTRPADTAGMRMLHTMIRVLDLDKSIAFYCNQLGMSLLRKKDFESGRFTLAFVGYGAEEDSAVIELTHNWDQKEPYETGTGFGHLALAVRDIHKTCDRLAAAGVAVAPGEVLLREALPAGFQRGDALGR